MKKQKSFRQHQRQKISGKTILIICLISFSFLGIYSIIFFNVFHSDKLIAIPNPPVTNIHVVQEQSWINEKEITAPIVKHEAVTDLNALLVKESKALPTSSEATH